RLAGRRALAPARGAAHLQEGAGNRDTARTIRIRRCGEAQQLLASSRWADSSQSDRVTNVGLQLCLRQQRSHIRRSGGRGKASDQCGSVAWTAVLNGEQGGGTQGVSAAI